MAFNLLPNFVSAQYLENYFDIFSPFIYAFILTRSTLGLVHIIFRTFLPELWPLIIKISLPLNILRTNGQILTKLYIDGAHGIGVQNVTSNCKVAILFFFSLYLARRLASVEAFIL